MIVEYLPILVMMILWVDVWVNALAALMGSAAYSKSLSFARWYTTAIVIAYTFKSFLIGAVSLSNI